VELIDAEIRALLELIYERFHYDFRDYSPASLKRRLRAALGGLGHPGISALREQLERDPRSFTKLLDYLTVQVSDMFRDPSFYQAMRARVVPELGTYPSIRVWVAGCSSGEEAYSLAILLHEEDVLDRTTIYATDINPGALAKADAGIYALDRMASFSANYLRGGGRHTLSDYYTTGYASASFDRMLRKRIVFSDHSLATDNVFAEVQVVSCRNVLIYFEKKLQERALGLFRDALCRRGFLGIGARESVQFTAHASAFSPLEQDRWYRRC
jgi:chemotaxis protein methyltransferase CheR